MKNIGRIILWITIALHQEIRMNQGDINYIHDMNTAIINLIAHHKRTNDVSIHYQYQRIIIKYSMPCTRFKLNKCPHHNHESRRILVV